MRDDLDLCRAFVDAHPADAARVLERLPPSETAALLADLAPTAAASVIGRMTLSAASRALEHLPVAAAALVAAELRPDAAARLLRRLTDTVRDAMLGEVPDRAAAAVRVLLRYPEGTAGALMDPRVPTLAVDLTARDALAMVRREPRHLLYYLYIVDREGHLAGVLDVRELLLARPSDLLASVMRAPVASLAATMSRAAILAHPGWTDYHALPVVDVHRILVGAMRYQTFRRLEQEASDRSRGAEPVRTVVALGELYWLGLSGVLDGLAAAVRRTSTGAPTEEEVHHDAP
jgi:magnesium transporter